MRVINQVATVIKSISNDGLAGLISCLVNFTGNIGWYKASNIFKNLDIDRRWIWMRVRNPFRRFIFITFADGITYSSLRLVKQTAATKIFSRIIAEDRDSLGVKFYEMFKSHVGYPRGFGYWCWKPFIIDRALSALRNGDLIVYADSGCSIEGFSGAYMLKNEILKLHYSESNISVAELWEQQYIRNWTKFDLLSALEESSNVRLLDKPQYEAGRVALIVRDETRAFVTEWLKHAKVLNLIDDSPSQSPELPGFIEHRHDQSIFAILLHRHKFVTGLENAILATRLKD